MGCGNTDNRQTNTTGTVVKNPVKNVQVAKTYDRWTTVKMNDEMELR